MEKQLINNLSRVTTYIETWAFDYITGEEIYRSHATGFFIRTSDNIFLVTNWHVVTGLNPENPNECPNKPTPHFLKIHVISRKNNITKLSLPLYDKKMEPLWYESNLGCKVDIIIYKLPKNTEKYFYFYDISQGIDENSIDTEIAKDVFILGYPFSMDELNDQFKEKNYFSFPIWKKGTIATEPKLLLNEKIILIDSLSRPGMSGAPVFVAEENDFMTSTAQRNIDAFKKLSIGDTSGLSMLDTESIVNKKKKTFDLLGIYSGVIGNTRLKEIALGKCWDKNMIFSIFENPKDGEIPFFEPAKNKYYEKFISSINGKFIFKDSKGVVIDTVNYT